MKWRSLHTKTFIKYLILAILAISVGFILGRSKSPTRNNKLETSVPERNLDIVFGNPDAPLSVYLYFRYDCVFCRKFYTEVYPDFKSDFLDTGKARLIMKLVDITHEEAVLNSMKTLVCINQYGNFSALHQLLLTEPRIVYTQEFISITEDFIASDAFVAECMIGGDAANYLLANTLEFNQFKLTGTPTFVINQQVYKGFIPYKDFKELIEKELVDALS
jgi:protein-disulfide isomerase